MTMESPLAMPCNIKTQINGKKHILLFDNDITSVEADALINIIWRDDKKFRNKMHRKVNRLTREKIREYGMKGIPLRVGGYIPIDDAKGIMCKLCIQKNPDAKKKAEEFNYSELKNVARRVVKKRLRDAIETLDNNYARKRVALTAQYKERCGEEFH